MASGRSRWLARCVLAAALALLVLGPPRAVAAAAQPAHNQQDPRLDHIKTQILAKLGLTSRPVPRGAPPRDVVRQILARAADPPAPHHDDDRNMREVIAIAQREYAAS